MEQKHVEKVLKIGLRFNPSVEELIKIGFRFNPSAEDLITFYLPLLIAGKPPKDAKNFIHNAAVYGSEPRDLAGKFAPVPRCENSSRFFYTKCKRQKGSSTRKERTAGYGTWVRQNSKEVKNTVGVKVGEIQSFRFKKDGRYTDWLMEEHHCCVQQAAAGDEEPVICRMYVSPRAPPDSAARQESAAYVRQEPAPVPQRQEHVITPPVTAKRPAPMVSEPACAKKMRGLVSASPVAHQTCVMAVAPPPPCVPQCPAPSSTPSSMPRRVMEPPPPRLPMPTHPSRTPQCAPQRRPPLQPTVPVNSLPRLPPRAGPRQPSVPTAAPPARSQTADKMQSLAVAEPPDFRRPPAAAVGVIKTEDGMAQFNIEGYLI